MTPSDKEIVLIVDDEAANLGVLFTELRQAGFKVLIAQNGVSTFQRLERFQPDIILLDVKLPDIDGFELCRRLKNEYDLQDTPFIFLSVLADTADKLKGLDLSAVDYITKPFDPAEVVARVQKHLRLRHLMKALEEKNRQLQQEVEDRKRIEEELQRAKEAAEAANRAKSAFLAHMNHELRTPLNAILGFANLLPRAALTEREQGYLDIIHRSGEHLLTLINQVLDLSKIEAGKLSVQTREVDLACLLDDLEDLFTLRAEQKGLFLRVDRGTQLPREIRVDDVKLRQILINLLNNAIKFTEKGGVIVQVRSKHFSDSARAEALTTNLHFSISDTGPGIAARDHERIFEAFVQTDAGGRAQEGTGLGLPLSRKFVQIMGGTIQVQSRSGGGATFIVTIPVELAPSATFVPCPSSRRVRALAPEQPDYRLLVVDDHRENRRLLVELLRLPGFHVREAANGKQAIAIWRSWPPHLIWMDLRMPVMNGYDAVNAIRNEELHKDSGNRRCSIIAVSASAFEEERDMALSHGCDDFLRKPFCDAEVFQLLETHLGVRFLYEEEQKTQGGWQKANTETAIPIEQSRDLPAEWRERMLEAATISNPEELLRLIDEIRPQHQTVAATLVRYLEEFDYVSMIKLIQEKHESSEADSSTPQIPEALAAMPEEWRREFRDAIEGLYIEQTLTLIDRIRTGNAPLADALTVLAQEYRFDCLREYLVPPGEITCNEQ